jgi:chorismate mutase
MSRFFAVPLFLSAIAACTQAIAAPASLDPLMHSIEQRLAIADQVALSKWDSHKAVEDRPREQTVIASAVALAPQYQLDGALVGRFFAAQIEANKLRQYALLSRWTLAGAAPDSPRPDLVGSIRPQLDVLQKRLLQQLAAFAVSRADPQCPQWLAAATHKAADDELQRLALIRATAELCAQP